MKKTIALLMSLTLLVSLFSGCNNTGKADGGGGSSVGTSDTSGGNQTTSSTKEITVWAWDPNFNIAIMNEAASRYSAKNPDVKITVAEMAKADVEQKLHTTLASKTKDGLPEIVLVEDYNAQKYLQSYPGSFSDLTGSINFDDFAKYKTEVMTLDGKIYGVPFDSGVTGMFYRTDILEEAGFTASDLENITWDQFIEIGKTVKEKTGKTLLALDKVDGGLMRVMLQSAGEWYFDKDGKPNLANNEALKEAVETYKKINDSGIAKPINGWNEWVGAINTGDSATINTGVWIIGSIRAAADQSGKWAVAPIPRLNISSSKNASNLGGSSWYILENSANKDIAIDFMKTIYAEDNDFYQTILVNNGAVGSYIPAAKGEAYTKEDEFFSGKAIYADLSKWITEIPVINYGLYTYEADSAIMSNITSYYDNSKTVEQMLQDAQAQLENQIQ